MIRPLELAIGLRYTRARRRSHFVSFITMSSILGIAVGVTALITVLSVMNGFEKELRSRILGLASHATVAGFNEPLKDWRRARDLAAQHPEVIGVAPYVTGEGMFTVGGNVQGAIIRGVLPSEEPQVSEVATFMKDGALTDLVPGKYGVLLGDILAKRLGVRIGNKVTLVAPQAQVTPVGILPRMRRFTVKGIFSVGHGQYDGGFALIHMQDAARLFQLGDGVTGVRLKLTDLYRARSVSHELAESMGGLYYVTDWTQHHKNFFRALATEKTVMFVILTLIVAVAAFNIVSTMIMVVTDKQAEIAILRTLGLTPGGIMKVFVIQGTVIGAFGTLFGGLGGIALALNVETIVRKIETIFGTRFLNPDIYFISDIPSDIRIPDVIAVLAVAFVMSVLATVYPAWRASRVQPAEALRYE
ncbi:MAG: lipoprotein-releasing system permease protein [Gammaproteobacteria bacterium]